MQLPDEQFRAGHIPTELYRQIPPGTDVHKIVIVQEAPRSYTGPIVLVVVKVVGTIAVLLVIAFVVQVIAGAIIAVLSATCGVTYSLNRKSRRRELSHAIRKRPSRSRAVRSKNRYRK
ncbi:hypothetical protein [Streptomyces sp. NPDC093544]|uniref:hypothetical protein n=1 Tax=Streptomyces sp. NPDC093544 TaxID=3155200 RepID=UPI0034156B03